MSIYTAVYYVDELFLCQFHWTVKNIKQLTRLLYSKISIKRTLSLTTYSA